MASLPDEQPSRPCALKRRCPHGVQNENKVSDKLCGKLHPAVSNQPKQGAFSLLFLGGSCLKACGILVPQSGIKPRPLIPQGVCLGSFDLWTSGSSRRGEGVSHAIYIFYFSIYLTACRILVVASSSLTKDQTQPPVLETWSLSHWITKEVPLMPSSTPLSPLVSLTVLEDFFPPGFKSNTQVLL